MEQDKNECDERTDAMFEGFTHEFPFAEVGLSVIVEDDGRVGYAYMQDNEKGICGDVWLYNRVDTPDAPEWHHPGNAPFLNPSAYVRDDMPFALPSSASDVSVDWSQDEQGWFARIYVRSKIAAFVRCGSRPGWSALAVKEGPLAKVLH